MIAMKVRESRNLDDALGEVEPKMRRNILRTALREGGNIVRDAARRGAPKASGLLQRSITTVLRRDRGDEVTASVGVFAPKATKGNKRSRLYAFYAMWVEMGHRIVPRGSKIHLAIRRRMAKQDGGFVKGRPFLLPALYAKRGEVLTAVLDHIRRRLDEVG